ncbi:MAG: desulfoferrodoxin family protein, partial [Patescibacteria group bacterium]
MNLLKAGVEDAVIEKHIPVVKKDGDKINVVVGEVAHPMDEDHYIEWITLVTESETKTVFLDPGDAPEANFVSSVESGTVYAYCNLHGLWKVKV